MSQVKTIAAFTILEAVRSHLFVMVLVFLVAVLGLVEFMGAVAITENLALKSGFLGALLRLFAVFIVSQFTISSMLREAHDKGLELVLSLPMSRANYYFGKLLGVTTVAAGVIIPIGCALLFYAPPWQVLFWMVSMACELLIVCSLSLLCLFTFSQAPVALTCVMGFYLLSRVINALQRIGHGPLIDPNSLFQSIVAKVVDGIAYVLPDLSSFTLTEWLIYHTATPQALLPIVGQTLIYLCLLIAAGLFDLYRKSF